MDIVKKIFPVSLRAKDVVGLIVSIIIYLILPVVFGLLNQLLSGVPVIGLLLGIIMWGINAYCFIGIILAVLFFCKVIK